MNSVDHVISFQFRGVSIHYLWLPNVVCGLFCVTNHCFLENIGLKSLLKDCYSDAEKLDAELGKDILLFIQANRNKFIYFPI